MSSDDDFIVKEVKSKRVVGGRAVRCIVSTELVMNIEELRKSMIVGRVEGWWRRHRILENRWI